MCLHTSILKLDRQEVVNESEDINVLKGQKKCQKSFAAEYQESFVTKQTDKYLCQ